MQTEQPNEQRAVLTTCMEFLRPRRPVPVGSIVSTRLGYFKVISAGHGRVILGRDGWTVAARRADIHGTVHVHSLVG